MHTERQALIAAALLLAAWVPAQAQTVHYLHTDLAGRDDEYPGRRWWRQRALALVAGSAGSLRRRWAA